MERGLGEHELGEGPLYKRIKARLVASLKRGEWRAGEALPSEARLAAGFAVSIGTVRKAIDELVGEKILVRQQGRGTFVAVHSEHRFVYHFFHIVADDGVRRFPSTELLAFERLGGSARYTDRLGLARGARLIHVRNLLRLDGEAVEVDDLYLPAARFAGLDRRIFVKRPGTIYQLYQERYGVNVVGTSERLRAVAAAPSEAAALGIDAGTPVLAIERLAFTYGGEPVELRIGHVHTAHHVYQNDFD